MTKWTSSTRAAALLAGALYACMAVLCRPADAFKTSPHKPGGENTPLSLGHTGSAATQASSSGGASLVRTIVGLAIVIAVIWGLYWILRQVKAGRDPSVGSAGLANVAALQLGSGRSLHLVRAGSDYVLLGANEHGLLPIQRYTEEQARDAGLLLEPEPRARRLPLARQLLAQQFTPPPAAPGQFTPGQVIPGHVAADRARRPNPMGAPAAGEGVLARLRELTVRR
jgi:flagellar protein FliO/FliZ